MTTTRLKRRCGKSLRKVLQPSYVLRLIKVGKLPRDLAGYVHCAKCGFDTGGRTASPDFWENGSYVYCHRCRRYMLARPVFVCELPDFPCGFELDLAGERKRYPLVFRS